MSYKIKTTSVFDKNLKRLSKRYPSVKTDFAEFLKNLSENPIQGTPLGNNAYKIRIKISSKNKGKSAGARIISHIVIQNKTVHLLTVYDKSDQETVSDKQIQRLINLIE